MIRRPHVRTGLRALRIMAAMLFVLAQNLAWAAPYAEANGPPAWLDGIPICHSGPDGSAEHHSSRMPDCALCVLCHSAGVAAVLPNPVHARPSSWRVARSVFRPFFAHAPPTDPVRPALFPTGPPILA